MSLDALNADDRVDQLCTLTERLTARLDAETRAYEACRPREAAGAMAQTAELANLYRHESLRIRQDPSLIAGATAARRQRLKELTRTFEATVARHGRAVKAAKSITEGLVQAIATEVAATRNSGVGYGPGARARGPDVSAITLNRRT